MGKKHDADDAAFDAATVALLRACQRKGAERDVLSQLTPREQQAVFEAEARHLRRRISSVYP